MTPEEWGQRQAALAPPWSDRLWAEALATLGIRLAMSTRVYASLPEPTIPCAPPRTDHPTLCTSGPPISDSPDLTASTAHRPYPTTQ